MSREKGDFAEKRAISFLIDLNYIIVETNFYDKKLGEIDIVAKKDNIYHFCEVKSANSFEAAVQNLTKSKLSKIKRSVDYYLQIKKLDVAFCIDAIIVNGDSIKIYFNSSKLAFYKNIFKIYFYAIFTYLKLLMERVLYEKELEIIKKSNRFRKRVVFTKDLFDLASNDYLGLAQNRKLFKKAFKRVYKNHYFSPKASMLVNGYSKIHKKFEDKLCSTNGFESAITVGSGFLANISMIEALVRKNDTLFIDEEYHASGILATKLLKPEQVVVFNHNDYLDLEKKILDNKRAGRTIIAIEGIYSMGGDLAPFEIFEIATKYKSLLIVDEAHSSG